MTELTNAEVFDYYKLKRAHILNQLERVVTNQHAKTTGISGALGGHALGGSFAKRLEALSKEYTRLDAKVNEYAKIVQDEGIVRANELRAEQEIADSLEHVNSNH